MKVRGRLIYIATLLAIAGGLWLGLWLHAEATFFQLTLPDLPKVKLGMSKPDVRHLLGEPHQVVHGPEVEAWRYSYSFQNSEGARIRRVRAVHFRDGVVVGLAAGTVKPHSPSWLTRLWWFVTVAVSIWATWALARYMWGRRQKGGSNDCMKCGYSLIGNTSGRCPECGQAISPDRVLVTGAEEGPGT